MQRIDFLNMITARFQVNPVVALLGPRQCGKTTLARQYCESTKQAVHYFDLENPIHLAKLEEPMLALASLEGLIVIDEIQLRRDLFPVLRVLVDEHKARQFLILGSASRDLIHQSSETLAGRISYIECSPFNLEECADVDKMFYRGGFPRSYLAETDEQSDQWRQDYISTFLERDIPKLGFRVPANTMRRFWMMLTHYHGQLLNSSELGKSLGVSHTSVRHYIDILTGTYMLRELMPWYENIEKRQVKTSKIYFRDSGLYFSLLNLNHAKQVFMHPKLGAAWEGFALEQIISSYHMPAEQCFFWALHQAGELDLLHMHQGRRIGFEFKYADAPRLTTAMRVAMDTLKLDLLYVIHPHDTEYALAPGVHVYGLQRFIRDKILLK